MSRRTLDQMLSDARSRLERVDASQAVDAVAQGAVLVDIRSDRQREADGTIPGAVHHRRNVLEWRLDPDSGASDPQLSGDLDRRVILVCDAGYQSSLAAAVAQDLGFANATDLAGGFQAWRAAGLPIDPPPDRG